MLSFDRLGRVMTDIDRKTEKITNRENHRDDPLMELTKLFNLNTSSTSGDPQTQNLSPRRSPSDNQQKNEGEREIGLDLSFLDDELENSLESTFNNVNEAQDLRHNIARPRLENLYSDDFDDNQLDIDDAGAEEMQCARQAPSNNASDDRYAHPDFTATSEPFFSEDASSNECSADNLPPAVSYTPKFDADQIGDIRQQNFSDPFGYSDSNSESAAQNNQFAEAPLQRLTDYQSSHERPANSEDHVPILARTNTDTFYTDDDRRQSALTNSNSISDPTYNEILFDTRNFGLNETEAFDEQNGEKVPLSKENLESDFTTPVFPQVSQPQPTAPLRFNNHIYSKVNEPQEPVTPELGAGADPQFMQPSNVVQQIAPEKPTYPDDHNGIEDRSSNRTFETANPAHMGDDTFDERPMTKPVRHTEFAARPCDEHSAATHQDLYWAENADVEQHRQFFDEEDLNGRNIRSSDQAPENYYDNAPLEEALDEFQSSNPFSASYEDPENNAVDQVPDVDTYKFEDERLKTIDNFELPPVPFEDTPKKEFFDSLEYEFEDVFNVGHLQEDAQSKEDQDTFFEDARRMSQPTQEDTVGYTENQHFDGTATNLHFDPNAQWGWNNVPANPLDGNGYSPQKSRRPYVLWGILGLLIIFIGSGYYYSKTSKINATPSVIHADASPYKVAVQPHDDKNHENLDIDAYESAAGHSEQSTQKVLVDTSEAPEDVAALNEKPPAATEDTIKEPSIENAISSATNQLVPTRVVPSVIVKADGSMSISKTDSSDDKNQASIASDTKKEDSIDSIVAETKNSPDIDSLIDNQEKTDSTPPNGSQKNEVNDAATDAGSNRSAAGDTVAQTGLPANREQQTEAPPTPTAVAQRPSPTSIKEKPKTAQSVVTPSAGGYYVQLASNPTQALAKTSLAKAKSEFGSIIGHLPIGIQEATIPNRGTYYRVRVQLGSRDEAVTLCETLKQHGASCFVGR